MNRALKENHLKPNSLNQTPTTSGAVFWCLAFSIEQERLCQRMGWTLSDFKQKIDQIKSYYTSKQLRFERTNFLESFLSRWTRLAEKEGAFSKLEDLERSFIPIKNAFNKLNPKDRTEV